MANVNKVILVGRLTRDPEVRTFSTGGKVANFGFAVNNRKKNAQTGQTEDEPMFIECKAFNRTDKYKLADTVEQYLHKGSLAYIEGSLHLETWDDKTTGQKRSSHKLYVDVMQMLDTRQGPGGPSRSAPPTPDAYAGDEGAPSGPPPTGGNEEIPF
jgi:single-strand DNA-binding protein